MAAAGGGKKRGKSRDAEGHTVKEASDTSLLSKALTLGKLGPHEKTEEQKASYAERMARLREALARHRQKHGRRQHQATPE